MTVKTRPDVQERILRVEAEGLRNYLESRESMDDVLYYVSSAVAGLRCRPILSFAVL